VFGVRSVETVEALAFDTLDELVDVAADRFAPMVKGKTFAVRPNRIGSHPWASLDLSVAAGSRLVAAGGSVDLTNPDVTVRVRIVNQMAYLTLAEEPGVGGLPSGTQGRALMMFSGGIDSPVAAYLMAHRGVAVDYLHFSMGCGQADHAAGIAHLLTDRYGAGTDPVLHVLDLEPAVSQIQGRVPAKQRQMALKAIMYRAAEIVANHDRSLRALINGESLGQVSTQTLSNLVALDRVVSIPVLRPLIGLDKATIMDKARAIGTLDVSSRTREMCDISGGAKVSVATSAGALASIAEDLSDLVEDAVISGKSMRLSDWVPGS
jgi:thiamine biosynthesis protein ThiI